MNKDLTKTAKLYKEVRDLLGLSQAQFARTLNISRSHICKIEQGLRDPRGTQVIEVMDLKRKALIKQANL